MKIAIASDHAGFTFKEKLKLWLQNHEYQTQDLGPQTDTHCDYPDFAAAVAQAVAGRQAHLGILICGTGIGMSIAANKVAGIRAGLCFNEKTAQLSRRHNDCNVLCLGTRTTKEAELFQIVHIWLNTDFGDKRHRFRVNKIGDIEKQYCNQGVK